MVGLTSCVWSLGLTELSEFGCKFEWYFIVLNVTVLAQPFAQRGTRPLETDWMVIGSGGAKPDRGECGSAGHHCGLSAQQRLSDLAKWRKNHKCDSVQCIMGHRRYAACVLTVTGGIQLYPRFQANF